MPNDIMSNHFMTNTFMPNDPLRCRTLKVSIPISFLKIFCLSICITPLTESSFSTASLFPHIKYTYRTVIVQLHVMTQKKWKPFQNMTPHQPSWMQIKFCYLYANDSPVCHPTLSHPAYTASNRTGHYWLGVVQLARSAQTVCLPATPVRWEGKSVSFMHGKHSIILT